MIKIKYKLKGTNLEIVVEGEFHGRHEFCTAAVGLKGRIGGSQTVRTGVCDCWAVFEVVTRE